MASERERWVGHLDLQLHVKRKPDNKLSLGEALKFLEAHKIAGRTETSMNEARWILQLADMNIASDQKTASLLFLGIDRERAAAVYGDLTTLNLRTAPKEPNEGGAVSAHLVISMLPDPRTGLHRAVLEEMEGMSRTRLVPYLRALLGQHMVFEETLPNGGTQDVKPHLQADVVLDKPIGEQLDEVRLLAVELFSRQEGKTIDKNAEYYERSRIVQFKPTTPSRGTKARRIIESILEKPETKHYNEVRIRMEEGGGRQRTVAINREKQDALTGAFQKRSLIPELNPAMPEASKTIVGHLTKKMQTILDEH